MFKNMAIIVLALLFNFGCSISPVKASGSEQKRNISGCAKYLSPSSTYAGGCADGDCNNGNGVFVYNNGDCYEGGNLNNIRHGHGIMYYRQWGEKYDGEWVNDNRVGHGTLILNNGDLYTGEFKLNVPWGNGVYKYADGSIEQGEFFDYLFVNVINLPGLTDEDKVEIGKVIEVNYQSGDVFIYAGDVKTGDKLFVEVNGLMAALEVIYPAADKIQCRMIGGTQTLLDRVNKGMPVFSRMQGIKRGNNTFLFPNGNRYVGEYLGNQMHGKGEFYWTNGNIYKGDYRNGMRHGRGVLTFYNGSNYSGDWMNGFMEGTGLYTWTNGNSYSGGFVKGYREGNAEFLWATGDKYVGEFKKDLMDGHGEYTAVNGESYSGEYKDDMKDGVGTYIWSFGDRYIGEWKKNLHDGKGTYIWSDGGRYVGDWKEHKMHGKGVEYGPDGKIIQQGLWDNGNYIGEGI